MCECDDGAGIRKYRRTIELSTAFAELTRVIEEHKLAVACCDRARERVNWGVFESHESLVANWECSEKKRKSKTVDLVSANRRLSQALANMDWSKTHRLI